MKPFNFKVSVENGSDEVVAQSDSKWNGVSNRCYIRIDKDSISYSIKDIETISISEKFSVKNSKTVVLEDDFNSKYILQNDEAEFVFKEYEVFEVESIIESGSKYKNGDLIYLSGGCDIDSESDNRACFEVTKVDNNGSIKMIRMKNSGRYSECPDNINIVSTDGKGTGAEIQVEFKSKSDRTSIRREIINKIPSDGKLILFLDSSIPENQKSGVLTLSKEKIILESEYLGVTNDSASHEIIRDFTPNYRLPFASPNTQNLEFVFNQAMSLLDKKLKEIESKIDS